MFRLLHLSFRQLFCNMCENFVLLIYYGGPQPPNSGVFEVLCIGGKSGWEPHWQGASKYKLNVLQNNWHKVIFAHNQ